MQTKPHNSGRVQSLCRANDFQNVRQTVTSVTTALEQSSLKDDTVSRIELVLAEVLNNIAEHGCNATRPETNYCVRWKVRAMGAMLQVEDCGPELPKALQHKKIETPDPFDLPEGGFGWGLIFSVCDAVRYKRRLEHNVLTMYFKN